MEMIETERRQKTLILGIGNTIVTDDGIGIHAAHEVKTLLAEKHPDFLEQVDVDEAYTGGLSLLDYIAGYGRVIIIDAIQTKGGKVGDIYQFGLDALKNTLHISSPHDVNFATALEIGKDFSEDYIPEDITIYAVEVEDITNFGEEMTPKAKAALPKVVAMVIEDILSQRPN